MESIPNSERSLSDIEDEIRDYVEAKGLYLSRVKDDPIDPNKIRLQIWKQPDGLPLLEREGLDEEIEIFKKRYESITGLQVKKIQFGGGATNILITLDKESEIS